MPDDNSAVSFAEFYGRSKDQVYRAILVAIRDPARAEDAVAEAFASAWGSWGRVSQMESPVGWVVKAAINRSRSDWRIWHRQGSLPELLEAVDAPTVDDELTGLVRGLPKRQRQVVALRILADLGEQETGRLLGISPKTVSVHLHRALASLRVMLEKAQEGESVQWTSRTSERS